jgi:endo-1,4-beta-xylanase
MNRRDFLKAVGVGGAASVMPAGIYPSRARSGGKTADRILDEVDARIEKYRKGDAVLRIIGPNDQPLRTDSTVSIQQTRHKFLFGCNIFRLRRCRTPEDNAAYERYFAELLNYATLPFYWWNYERQRGKPDDDRTEEIVRWCKAHNVTTKGHPLVWNWAEPRWLPDDPEAAMQAQLERVRRCVSRFKNDIDIWDVVNEATHYDRPALKKRAPKLTEAIRQMGVGAYVRAAFGAAREANPQATLIINDYRTDADYIDKVLSKLVDDSGRPLYDVIGIQSHMHGGYWGAARAWQVCERFAKSRASQRSPASQSSIGKPLHFTETTVVSGPRRGQGWGKTTTEDEKRQAEQVAEFYRTLVSHPAVEAITWWDFTDQGAWQRAPAGFLREDMTPKPAYDQLKDLIKGKWWTRTEAKLSADETVRFRGFFGHYEVVAHVDGRRVTGSFAFDKKTKQPIELRLG